MVVSLLLLLIMTLLALGASQSTKLQERMAGNQRDVEMALQSAEASLRAGEKLLAPVPNEPVMCSTAGGSACDVYFAKNLPADMTSNDPDWWTKWGRAYTEDMGVHDTPEFVIERIGQITDSLTPPNYATWNLKREFDRVTARSSGLTESSEVVLQTTHARITFE